MNHRKHFKWRLFIIRQTLMDFGRLGRAGQLQSGLEPPLPSCHNSVKICRPHWAQQLAKLLFTSWNSTSKNENIGIAINTNFYSFIISELLKSDPRTDRVTKSRACAVQIFLDEKLSDVLNWLFCNRCVHERFLFSGANVSRDASLNLNFVQFQCIENVSLSLHVRS